MRSFRHKPDPRQAAYNKLAGSVESQLRDAYASKHERGLVNQAGLAKLLGVNRSVINRRLSGATNLTLQSIADLVWGMGHAIEVSIYDPADRPEKNGRPEAPPTAFVETPKRPTLQTSSVGTWGDTKIHKELRLEVQS